MEKLGFLNILGPKKEFNWDFPILSYFGGKLGFVFVLKTARTALALLLQPHPPFSYFFFKNLASGLNLNRPETPVATRADSGAPPLYFSGGECVGLGPLSWREIFSNPPSPTGATRIRKRRHDRRRGEDVREGDQPPPRMDDGPAPCFPVSEFE